MQTILVPTDFSTAALNAAEYAADMAVNLGKDILLLNVYALPMMYTEMPVAMNVDEMMKDADKYLLKVKLHLLARTGGKIRIDTDVKPGSFMQELTNACQRIQPYAVVMGSQGTTAAERFLFGGHTVEAMRDLEWPLITVPPGAAFSAVRKIALACDLNNVKDTIPVEHLKQLVKDFGATLHILNTGDKDVFNPDNVTEAALLQKMLGDLHPEYHFIASNNAYQGLIDFSVSNHVDLLIVFPRHHNLPESLIHKSHSKRVVLNSPVPVMALH